MGKLKSLAGQTAIYGVPSILGRTINYLMVILHTEVFLREEMGVFTVLYAYVAILNIIYAFGMETAFFRFINKWEGQAAYNIATTVVLTISTVVSGLIFINASSLAVYINYPDQVILIKWLAIILWIDGILAIPFARLRQLNKARYFAVLKVGNILFNIGLQLIFLLLLPYLEKHFGIHYPKFGIGYIVLANLIANALLIPFLGKYLISVKLRISWDNLRPMLIYAFPIFLMGLAGMVNEVLDKILLGYLLADDFYPSMTTREAVGVYGQTFKLSIFMMLSIQAFRYAAEPFFFKEAKDKKAPKLFARVMHYFIIASLVIFLAVSVNVDLLAFIFLRKPEYRVALYLVPVLLGGKFFFGVYTNLNVWFKITDKTYYGTYFSILGALITIIGNVLLIPLLGFTGSAISALACYFIMAIACYYFGRRNYPIPYQFGKVFPYIILSVTIVIVSFLYQHENFVVDSVVNIIASAIIIAAIAVREIKLFRKNPNEFY